MEAPEYTRSFNNLQQLVDGGFLENSRQLVASAQYV